MSRTFVARGHLVSGLLSFGLIATFWTSTALSELLGSAQAVATVKGMILWGMLVLVPAIVAAGASGFRLGGRSRAPIVAAKRFRMPFIAANGLLILVPAAFFLAGRAEAGQFDATFYGVQALELAAGAINLSLMGLNIRDGFAMTGARRMAARRKAA